MDDADDPPGGDDDALDVRGASQANRKLLRSLAQGERRQNWILLALVCLVCALVITNIMTITGSPSPRRDEAQPARQHGAAGGYGPAEEMLWPTSRFSTRD